MGNLPNITQTEMAVIAAAVLLLFVAPALLAWTDERRRRRAQRAALVAEALRIASVEVAAPATDAPVVEAALPDVQQSVDAGLAPTSDVVTPPPTASERVSPPPTWAASDMATTSTAAPAASPELQPLSGAPRHRFRLDELHQAQLSDWPPAAIRNDPERSRVRHEAERGAEPYHSRIRETVIASPYPARSHCLGAADADASELRLSFLLFPVVWPVSQNQAVAQAVFRIDRVTGEIRGWVDALRLQELSDENRREIHEAGGDV